MQLLRSHNPLATRVHSERTESTLPSGPHLQELQLSRTWRPQVPFSQRRSARAAAAVTPAGTTSNDTGSNGASSDRASSDTPANNECNNKWGNPTNLSFCEFLFSFVYPCSSSRDGTPSRRASTGERARHRQPTWKPQ